ncbi:MotA/TolQ/ExbB proton channel family protein [Sulfitobacter sp. LCG007]
MIIRRTEEPWVALAIAGKAAERGMGRSVGVPVAAFSRKTAVAALIAFSLGAAAMAQEPTQPPEIGVQLPALDAPVEFPGPDPSPRPAAGIAAPATTNPPLPAGSAAQTVSGVTASPVESADTNGDNGPEAPATQRSSEPVPGAASATGDVLAAMQGASDRVLTFLRNGGPAIWAIAALSVVTFALILWKAWRLALLGAWSRGKSGQAVEAYLRGDMPKALDLVDGRRGIRSQVMATTLRSLRHLSSDAAREETARVAKRQLASARDGLGALELIATVAPLLGLLGTVLGMIAAFQALQEAGSRADPALLAGGIWEALLTTAAGMAVAIPASAALTWFEAVVEQVRRDIEDNATRVFIASQTDRLKLAAE